MVGQRINLRRALPAAAALVLAALVAAPVSAAAQWSTTYDQFYLPGKFNWQLRKNYPAADRLFNGFDFGHAILYETLWTNFAGSVEELERTWYNRLTRGILLNPPRVPLEEAAIEIAYAKLAPEAKQMFDWAHLLHRQIYDVWAAERMSPDEKDVKVAELLRYYRSRPDIAFSTRPKSMALMQEQPYSLAFRKNYPKFNGLIWAYHWLQIGLYEPLLVGRTVDEKQAGVRAALARFWQMLQDPPRTMPYVMPMASAVAPEFAKRYPEAAIIFDNLHSMHDVVSDVLANPSVPNDRKRTEILLAARRYRDDTSFVISEQAWRTMAEHMGVQNMGGAVLGVLWPLPTPTVTYGAVMTHDERTGEMTGFKYGEATGGEHTGHAMAPDSARGIQGGTRDKDMKQMMELQMRMMADSVIRQRIMADTALRRMMADMMQMMANMMRDTIPEHREQVAPPEHEARPASATPPSPAAKPAATPSAKPPATKPPATKPADPHAGHPVPAKPAPKKPPATDSTPNADLDEMPGLQRREW